MTKDFAEHFLRATPQGHEVDSSAVQLLQLFIGRQLGVEDQFGGRRAGVFLPEVDKAQNLARLLGLGDAGVGVA